MSYKFIPSDRSEKNQTLSQLRFLRKSAAALEQQLAEDGELPSWVKSRVAKAAAETSIATSYLLHLREKEKK